MKALPGFVSVRAAGRSSATAAWEPFPSRVRTPATRRRGLRASNGLNSWPRSRAAKLEIAHFARSLVLLAAVATALSGSRPPGGVFERSERLDELAQGLRDDAQPFPALLSDTGAFVDAATLAPGASLVPFEIRVGAWSDGAEKRRWISLPPGARIGFAPSGPWRFPEGTVLVKHFEIAREGEQALRVETRLLVRTADGGVRGASYRWRASQDEADRVEESVLGELPARGGAGESAWSFPGPRDCLECHTAAAGRVLGLRANELDAATLREWSRLGRFEEPLDEGRIAAVAPLPELDDVSVAVETRARAWLDVQCAGCHRPGGSIDDLDARFEVPLELQRLVDVPARIDLGLDRARRIAPNDPWRSVVLARVRDAGALRMPPLGPRRADQHGVELLREWIASLPGPDVLGPLRIEPPGRDADGPVTATISHGDPLAEIRYTLDGSSPGPSSTRYAEPLKLERSTTLRARAFRDGWARSIPAQETYVIAAPQAARAPAPARSYLICVSNERSGDVTVIDGTKREVVATIPVGKRPRGIHAAPGGRRLYVAVSGTPIAGPPQLDAHGAPIEREVDPEERDAAADGIAVVDLSLRKLVDELDCGTDPEEFALTRDGTALWVSNEDVATASRVSIPRRSVDAIARVKQEPEGVALTPDGRFVYVTCESGGEVVVIDAASGTTTGEISVGGRPRSVAFLPDGSRAFVPSETAAKVSVVDTAKLSVLRSISLPEGSRPMGVAVARDGAKLFVTNGRRGTVSVIDVAAERVRATIAVGTRPWGLALSPDGTLLYVANGPSDDVSVIDVLREQEIARLPAGKGPWGVAIVEVPGDEEDDP
jgi:YVTN family beta-propeller protein